MEVKESEPDYSRMVIDQFFQQFYDGRVNNIKGMPAQNSEIFDLSVFTFWCGVIDFYGGLYWIAKHDGKTQKRHKGKFILSTGGSFSLFVRAFFDDANKGYGSFIYSVFRNGVIHQLAPKKAHIYWEHPEIKKLVWLEISEDGKDHENKIAHLNVSVFQELAFNAYNKFKSDLQEDKALAKNIWKALLSASDGLKDGECLHNSYVSLPKDFKKRIVI